MRVSARLLALAAFAVTVVVSGVGLMVQNLNRDVDDVSKNVDHMEKFVETLEAPPTANEAARNKAISDAVKQVPQIRSILCEQFPEATACK